MERGIFLLLGSNLGDRELNLTQAKQRISTQVGKILRNSSIYKTAPWGYTGQPEFYNQAIEIQSALEPIILLRGILEIEKTLGRTRIEKWGSRIIDIDILFWGDQIINHSSLVIPHPEIANRRFALQPMAEIASTYKHPILKKNIETLLLECRDNLAVEKIS